MDGRNLPRSVSTTVQVDDAKRKEDRLQVFTVSTFQVKAWSLYFLSALYLSGMNFHGMPKLR